MSRATKTKARTALIAIVISIGVHSVGYACLSLLGATPDSSKEDLTGFFADEQAPAPLDITEVAVIEMATIAPETPVGESAAPQSPVLETVPPKSPKKKPKKKTKKKPVTRVAAEDSTPALPKDAPVAPPLTPPITTSAGGWGAAIAANSRKVTGWDRLDLVELAPGKDTTAVLLRFDLLRKTPWAKAAEAVLEPMPDYQLFIDNDAGEGIQSIVDEFEILLISSSNPRDVTKTQLAGLLVRPTEELKSRLHRPTTPVQWQDFPAGALGTRLASGKRFHGDKRNFFLAKNKWAFLTAPSLTPSLLDQEKPDSIIQRVTLLSSLREEKQSPALVLGLRPVPFSLKKTGIKAPRPSSAVAYVDVPKKGLLLRGRLGFSSESDATLFLNAVEARRKQALSDPFIQGFLRGVHGYNAISKMQLLQKGKLILFSTSLSNSDGKALLSSVAALSKAYYGKPRKRRP